jgi:hypothetical protein
LGYFEKSFSGVEVGLAHELFIDNKSCAVLIIRHEHIKSNPATATAEPQQEPQPDVFSLRSEILAIKTENEALETRFPGL